MIRQARRLLFTIILVAGCSSNPYLDASLKPAEMEGKDKAWFEKNWGPPTGKAPRFFGGEEWTYFRIAGEKAGRLFSISRRTNVRLR